MILVTGGAGFIGSNFVQHWLAHSDAAVVNLDKLIYAGNLQNLATLENDDRHIFVQGDIGDLDLVNRPLAEHRPRAILNSVAESLLDAAGFIATLHKWQGLWSPAPRKSHSADRRGGRPSPGQAAGEDRLWRMRGQSVVDVLRACRRVLPPALRRSMPGRPALPAHADWR